MPDSKYAVFKIDDHKHRHPLDAFVIRPTDLFGPAALHGYVHLVQSTLELARTRQGMLSDQEYRQLEDLCDEVSSIALHWQELGLAGKIPD